MKLLAIGLNKQPEYIETYKVGEWMEGKKLADYSLFAYSERAGIIQQINTDPRTPKDYKNWLKMLIRPIIVICDNDVAGEQLAEFGDYVEVIPEGKDLGESSDDYVQFLVNKYATL
jgi:hypothetical protein